MKLKMSILGFASTALAITSIAKSNDAERKLLDPANIDQTVKPSENFYRFANGAWLNKNPIPASETRWGSFSELQENNYTALKSLLDAAAAQKNAPIGSPSQMVGDFYKSAMDSAAMDKAGITPLKAMLQRIDNIKDGAGILQEMNNWQTQGIGSAYGFGIGPDDKNVSKEICQFNQGGLSLPDRDYYFKTDARTTKIRETYPKYIADLLRMAQFKPADIDRDVINIFKIETELAKASMTRVEMRDPYKTYNKFTLAELNKKTPGINWTSLFKDLKIAGQDTCLVAQPHFFEELGRLLNEYPVIAWKAYLKFHLINSMAPFLGTKFDNTRFQFYGKIIRGQQEQKPRWKRVLSMVDGSLGEILGKMYVDKYFKPEAKKRMLDLVNNLQGTYADRIKRLDWMSGETKTKALIKLNTFLKKIGYTDKWKNYAGVKIVPNNIINNMLSTNKYEYNFELAKLGKPVDRTEWGMTPPTVNAYYNPAFNEIVFPAGILQYPFFDFNADDAVNYGGIGAVIGHEMTHGFDDQGRQYDASGNLNDWWTPEDAKKFTEKADVVIKQFNNYTVLDTVHVNGELTIGENLADLGGINIALEAFKKTKQGKSEDLIDGYKPIQRFFLSWAQVWRANTRPEEMASRIMTDPHSPSELRCNGPLSNMPEFYEAFGVKTGDKMYRDDAIRAKVW